MLIRGARGDVHRMAGGVHGCAIGCDGTRLCVNEIDKLVDNRVEACESCSLALQRASHSDSALCLRRSITALWRSRGRAMAHGLR